MKVACSFSTMYWFSNRCSAQLIISRNLLGSWCCGQAVFGTERSLELNSGNRVYKIAQYQYVEMCINKMSENLEFELGFED